MSYLFWAQSWLQKHHNISQKTVILHLTHKNSLRWHSDVRTLQTATHSTDVSNFNCNFNCLNLIVISLLLQVNNYSWIFVFLSLCLTKAAETCIYLSFKVFPLLDVVYPGDGRVFSKHQINHRGIRGERRNPKSLENLRKYSYTR